MKYGINQDEDILRSLVAHIVALKVESRVLEILLKRQKDRK